MEDTPNDRLVAWMVMCHQENEGPQNPAGPIDVQSFSSSEGRGMHIMPVDKRTLEKKLHGFVTIVK